MSATDQVIPGAAWRFDDAVTDVFDDMLARSIPQYDVMRAATTDLITHYAKEGSRIVDYGCSRGAQLARIIERLGAHNRYLGIEISEPMINAARVSLAPWIEAGMAEIRRMDLRTELPAPAASVAYSVLTLQFVPIEYRQHIVQHIYDTLVPGGAFVLVEKCLGSNFALDRTFIDLYYELKQRNGYTPNDIDRKRMSLEGVLVPITAAWNEQLLINAGFRSVDCYWRWMNFAGWIAVKV
jgi:tRNA (cmo5U34)-methyltransferase